MSNSTNKIPTKLDIFPEAYGSGLSIEELRNIIDEVETLDGNDMLLVLTKDSLKLVSIAKLQEAIGGSGGGDPSDNLHTYATITE